MILISHYIPVHTIYIHYIHTIYLITTITDQLLVISLVKVKKSEVNYTVLF